MRWSFRIFRVAGIDVKIHVTFLLLLAFLGWSAYSAGGPVAAILNVAFVSLLFLCVLLHEFGHAFAARAYGIQTPDITLLPIGGVARLARMPSSPVQEFVIAIAGPMVNVVIGLGLWLALGMPSLLGGAPESEDLSGFLMGQLLWVNKMLIAFNLIPAFPMDGGRVLRALLALRLGHARATAVAARVGQVIAVGFLAVGVFGIPGYFEPDFFLVFIAMFVFMGAQQEADYAKMRAALGGLRVRDAMVTRFHWMYGDMSIDEAATQAQRETQPIFPVTDSQLRLQGMVLRNDLLDHEPANPQSPLATIAKTIPAVSAETSFDDAFHLMQESSSAVLPVVNAANQVVGLVSLNLLHERASGSQGA